MITLEDYWTGPGGVRRDQVYSLALTHDIVENAVRWVDVANKLIERLELYGVMVDRNPSTGTQLNSGWRPPAVNAAVPTASKTSLHMVGLAGDVHDENNRIDTFLMTPAGQSLLIELGVWLEHPDSTPQWSHWQIVPPHSGNRVFKP
jgi:hypothetical protein